MDYVAVEIGVTYFGDPDAFYGLERDTQLRLLGFWRARLMGGPGEVRKTTEKKKGSRLLDTAKAMGVSMS